MKILITGAGGQLAWELARSIPEGVAATFLARAELDITDAAAVENAVVALKPDAIINGAAYTAVDRAESDRATASAVNTAGAANLARACAAQGAYLLHISTDFVFDGHSGRAYRPDDATQPLSVYGATKLAGEQQIAQQMPDNWAVIRTAWVYSSHGNNFVKTMLRLMREKPALGVVSDQIGTPTWAAGLARLCWAAARERVQGTYHWTDAGVASWYDFAVAIQTMAVTQGLLTKAIPINPIRTEDYPTPAPRPFFSVLDKSATLAAIPSITFEHWQTQLHLMLTELNP